MLWPDEWSLEIDVLLLTNFLKCGRACVSPCVLILPSISVRTFEHPHPSSFITLVTCSLWTPWSEWLYRSTAGYMCVSVMLTWLGGNRSLKWPSPPCEWLQAVEAFKNTTTASRHSGTHYFKWLEQCCGVKTATQIVQCHKTHYCWITSESL